MRVEWFVMVIFVLTVHWEGGLTGGVRKRGRDTVTGVTSLLGSHLISLYNYALPAISLRLCVCLSMCPYLSYISFSSSHIPFSSNITL